MIRPELRRARTAAEVRQVVSADGTTLAVERVTDGATTVLMVPGGPSGRRRWADVAAQLDGEYACWLMDRRGRGDSGDTEPYSYEREYEDLTCVAADVVGLPAPVVATMRRAPVWEEWTSYVHVWPREMRETEKLCRDTSLLAAAGLPTLMLRGGLTDGKLRQATTVLAAALPTASIVELPGQGHGALGTAPELVAAAIRPFAATLQ